jgi:hypothetical protein
MFIRLAYAISFLEIKFGLCVFLLSNQLTELDEIRYEHYAIADHRDLLLYHLIHVTALSDLTWAGISPPFFSTQLLSDRLYLSL